MEIAGVGFDPEEVGLSFLEALKGGTIGIWDFVWSRLGEIGFIGFLLGCLFILSKKWFFKHLPLVLLALVLAAVAFFYLAGSAGVDVGNITVNLSQNPTPVI